MGLNKKETGLGREEKPQATVLTKVGGQDTALRPKPEHGPPPSLHPCLGKLFLLLLNPRTPDSMARAWHLNLFLFHSHMLTGYPPEYK